MAGRREGEEPLDNMQFHSLIKIDPDPGILKSFRFHLKANF